MARRPTYSRVERIGFSRPAHVRGMGGRPFRVFQCLNAECVHMHVVDERQLRGEYSIECPECGYIIQRGGARHLLDYRVIDANTQLPLLDEDSGEVIDPVPEFVNHDEYVERAARFKYCIICSALKPFSEFHVHGSRGESGLQGECITCKRGYNAVKNGTRLIEQHREASQQRRLYMNFQVGKLNVPAIVERFRGRCFKCNQPVALDEGPGHDLSGNIDHTRPAYYLWPLTTEDATLLCRKHNGDKSAAWPGEFYNDDECRKLARLTGIPYRELTGPPRFNPEAIEKLRDPEFVEGLIDKFARYPNEMLKLRNRILRSEGFDFLAVSPNVSENWRRLADEMLDG